LHEWQGTIELPYIKLKQRRNFANHFFSFLAPFYPKKVQTLGNDFPHENSKLISPFYVKSKHFFNQKKNPNKKGYQTPVV
jgi:hypothetical protein